jgi:hypothetical protein
LTGIVDAAGFGATGAGMRPALAKAAADDLPHVIDSRLGVVEGG